MVTEALPAPVTAAGVMTRAPVPMTVQARAPALVSGLLPTPPG
jgi:hypothetical protein